MNTIQKKIHDRVWFNPYAEKYFVVTIIDGKLHVVGYDDLPDIAMDDSTLLFRGRLEGAHDVTVDAKNISNTVLFMCPPAIAPTDTRVIGRTL